MKARLRTSDQRGVTLIEIVVSLLASSIIILSIGRIVTTNQSMIKGGSDKAVLQQELSRTLVQITNDVRAAHSVVRTGNGEFRTFDKGGTQLHVYQRVGADDDARIRRDGVLVTDRICTVLTAATNADSTHLHLDLTFADLSSNRVAGHTAASVRNRTTDF